MTTDPNDRAHAGAVCNTLSDLLTAAADALAGGDDLAATAALRRVREALNGVEVQDEPDWGQFTRVLEEVHGIRPLDPPSEDGDGLGREERALH